MFTLYLNLDIITSVSKAPVRGALLMCSLLLWKESATMRPGWLYFTSPVLNDTLHKVFFTYIQCVIFIHTTGKVGAPKSLERQWRALKGCCLSFFISHQLRMSLFPLCREEVQPPRCQTAWRFFSLYSRPPLTEERSYLITLANSIKFTLMWIDFDFNLN